MSIIDGHKCTRTQTRTPVDLHTQTLIHIGKAQIKAITLEHTTPRSTYAYTRETINHKLSPRLHNLSGSPSENTHQEKI